MSTERQRGLQIQIVLFWSAAIVVGAIGFMVYLRLMPAFDLSMDMQEYMNAMMYATSVSVVFSAISGILAIIGIVKLVQYFKT